jgi:Fic family protein
VVLYEQVLNRLAVKRIEIDLDDGVRMNYTKFTPAIVPLKILQAEEKEYVSKPYKPPYTITPVILHVVEEIGELIGRYSAITETRLTPMLRRGNRIRSIQASLAIENNTLTVEQVTAVIDGKRVMGLPREIQEVRNAFAAYDKIDHWNPASIKDLLEAHATLTAGLIDESGTFRSGGVGIYKGQQLIHMAPPADRVHSLMTDLIKWLASTNEHPIAASCIFHYEFEFIHPFSDGNGRLGRLWQTLILSKWKPLWTYLPVETIISEQQSQYYDLLGKADTAGDATPFMEFMVQVLKQALAKAITMDRTEQDTEQVTEQVKKIIHCLKKKELSVQDAMVSLQLRHRPTFMYNYLQPAITAGLVEMTQPDSPKSPTQRYRLTARGKSFLK